jgi:excisionase family DNA binding protein
MSITPKEGYAKVTEAAEYLHISKAMVSKMIHAGKIPYQRFGKIFRIPWAWLTKEVEARSTKEN